MLVRFYEKKIEMVNECEEVGGGGGLNRVMLKIIRWIEWIDSWFMLRKYVEKLEKEIF